MSANEQDNIEIVKEKIGNYLKRKGFLIDSPFEGDFIKWVGVYARPMNRPTYLDANDSEEAEDQERFSVGGSKQDFAEWFEWVIVGTDIVDFD